MPVIEVTDLTRTFRSRSRLRRSVRTVQAGRGISFAVERGELFGLLGPNGAGKTMTITMLITLLRRAGRLAGRERERVEGYSRGRETAHRDRVDQPGGYPAV